MKTQMTEHRAFSQTGAIVAVGLISILAGHTAGAATYTWSNTVAANPYWSTASNWGGTVPSGTDVGLFNRNPEATTITVKLSDLGLSGSQPVRDVWSHRDLPRASGGFSAEVPRHGVVLVKIGTPKK